MAVIDTEGPISLGPEGDIVWFARGRVAVGVPKNWTGGRADALRQIRSRYERVGKPLALAILGIDLPSRPNEETREDIRRTFNEMSPMLACQSIAILESGFLASLLMSISAQLLRVSKSSSRSYRIHADLESTAAWMHQELNDPGTSLEEIAETLLWAAGQGPAPGNLTP
ncbi:MAG: hypothetical protein ACN4G0_17580 [Polyangiales bacterium]